MNTSANEPDPLPVQKACEFPSFLLERLRSQGISWLFFQVDAGDDEGPRLQLREMKHESMVLLTKPELEAKMRAVDQAWFNWLCWMLSDTGNWAKNCGCGSGELAMDLVTLNCRGHLDWVLYEEAPGQVHRIELNAPIVVLWPDRVVTLNIQIDDSVLGSALADAGVERVILMYTHRLWYGSEMEAGGCRFEGADGKEVYWPDAKAGEVFQRKVGREVPEAFIDPFLRHSKLRLELVLDLKNMRVAGSLWVDDQHGPDEAMTCDLQVTGKLTRFWGEL